MRYKWLIAATWLAIIAGIGIALRNMDGPPSPAVVIATLSTAKPGTVFRPSDYLLWTEAAGGQPLGDGDFVATSKNGGATLAFEDGRTLSLGPDTILIVTKSGGDTGAMLTVNLVQGRVMAPKPAAKKTYAAKIQIEVGNRTVELTPKVQNFSIALQQNTLTIKATPGGVALKERGKAVAQTLKDSVTIVGVKPTATKSLSSLLPRVSLAAKPAPVLTAPVAAEPKTKSMPELSKAGQVQNVAFKPATVPEPEAAPEPVEKTTTEVPRVRLQPSQRGFWTAKDLVASLPALKVAWTATVTNATAANTSAQLTCGGRTASRVSLNGRRINLPAQGEQLGNAKSMAGTGGERILECQAAILTADGTVTAKSNNARLALRSLTASKPGAVTVLLDTMRRNAADINRLWHTDNGSIARSEARTIIRLADSSLMQELIPWLSGSSGFAIVAPEPISGEAYHYLRGGNVIASVTMDSPRLEALKLFAKDLKADMLFYGRPNDFMPSSTAAGRKNWLEARAAAGQSIYILDDGKFVEMDPKFLLSRGEAQVYVEERSLNWFVRPVQVLR